MRITFGAHTATTDGKTAGTVGSAVMDADAHSVTDIIVRTGAVMHQLYLVPLAEIASVAPDGVVRLRLDASHLTRMPQYVVEKVVVADDEIGTEWRYLIPTGQIEALAPSFPDTPAVEGIRVYDPARDDLIGVEDPTDRTVETISNLPEGAFTLGKGTHVSTKDGHRVGSLHALDLGTEGKVEAIMVAHVLSRKHQVVPRELIDSLHSHQIVLNISKAEFDAR